MNLSYVKRLLFLFFVLLPFGLVLYGTINFAVDMPYADEWGLVPCLQKSIEGTLTVRDLFQQHNESRIFFPRMVMIGLARLTGWNTNYEIGVIVLMAILTFLLLSVQSVRTCVNCLGQKHVWLIIFFSALVFSLLQYECWTFGFTLVGYMNILFVVAGLFLLAMSPFSWLRFAGSLVAGTVATYSYSNGVFYWLVGLLALLLISREQRNRGKSVAPYIIWILFSAAVIAFYFTGYQKPAGHPTLLFSFKYPASFFGYLFAFLGGAIVNIPELSVFVPITIGMIGLLIFVLSSIACFYSAGTRLKLVSLWVALGLYAVLTGLAVALGRSAYGLQQALAGRYTMFSSLFWISTLVMATVIIKHVSIQPSVKALDPKAYQDKAGSPISRKRVLFLSLRNGLFLFAAVCLVFFIISSCYAMKSWKQHYTHMRSIRNELLSFLQDETLLAQSLPEIACLKGWSNLLTQYRLSVFREKKAFQDYQIVEAEAGHIESVQGDLPRNKVFFNGTFQISGRACDPEQRKAARAVILVNSNCLIIARADVTPASRHTRDYSQAGWILSLQAAKLPAGISTIDAYALFRDGSRIARIGTLTLEMIPESDMKTIFPINTFVEYPSKAAGYTDNISLDGTCIRGHGWARNPLTDKPGQWVIITDQERNILVWARITDERRDVARHLRNNQLLRCGWHFAFDKNLLNPGYHILQAYLILPEEEKALKLNNDFEVVIP